MSVEFPRTRRVSRDLPGLTLADVALDVAQKADCAAAEWFPTYTYTTRGAVIATVRVIVPTIVRMPRWRGYASASPADRREWNRFSFALDAHQRGHIDLVKEHLGTVDQRMVGTATDEARRIWRDALAAVRFTSDAYDIDTDHGRSQGTILDAGGELAAAG